MAVPCGRPPSRGRAFAHMRPYRRFAWSTGRSTQTALMLRFAPLPAARVCRGTFLGGIHAASSLRCRRALHVLTGPAPSGPRKRSRRGARAVAFVPHGRQSKTITAIPPRSASRWIQAVGHPVFPIKPPSMSSRPSSRSPPSSTPTRIRMTTLGTRAIGAAAFVYTPTAEEAIPAFPACFTSFKS